MYCSLLNRLCSANQRAGYFSNLPCDWLSIVWAYSKQKTENGPWYCHKLINCDAAITKDGNLIRMNIASNTLVLLSLMDLLHAKLLILPARSELFCSILIFQQLIKYHTCIAKRLPPNMFVHADWWQHRNAKNKKENWVSLHIKEINVSYLAISVSWSIPQPMFTHSWLCWFID